MRGYEGDPWDGELHLRYKQARNAKKERRITMSNEHNVPSIAEMSKAVAEITWRIMSNGSAKSAFGEWLYKDKPTYDYHICRAIKHAVTAQQQIHLNEPQPDNNGETAIDHLERTIVRALFAWFQLKRQLPRL